MNKKANKCCKKTSIGGQAVIEGIMMRGPKRTVLSVRTPESDIVTEDIVAIPLKEKYKILGAPVLRGVVNFAQSMIIGYKTLMRSAELSGMTDLEEEEKKEELEKSKKPNKFNDFIMPIVMTFASILGIGIGVVLFMYVPTLIFNFINKAAAGNLDNFRGLLEGLMKITIFIGYVSAVSLMKEIKRVFMYHGAEHKTIFCYENGEELTIENVRKQSRFHPRCGTSFMFLMIAVGIIIASVILFFFPSIADYTVIWVAVKILLIPLFCGLGYELIKFCGRHDNVVTRIIAAPGLLVQRITTKEPDDSMIEVAIEAIKAVIPENSEDDRW